MHLACLAIPFVGFSWVAIMALVGTYIVRVFALTGGYHRYFSHRSFKTSRLFQFVLAFTGASAAQLGPLWWASHHRHHHLHSDGEGDNHSPLRQGFFWSHVGWLFCRKHELADERRVRDLQQFPELRFLDRYHVIAPLTLALVLYAVGDGLRRTVPSLGTTGWQLVVWGFVVSTVLVYHVTFCVNSVTHMVGKQPFDTKDESRNSLLVALLTMGEGWHNNHHHYPLSARQGFTRGEIDMTYYVLLLLEKLGLIWELKQPPANLLRRVTPS
ncbi:MAG: acyl-CoA desaturase [Verrucomicrobia bacterium]|nr:acyl-CoA desaturase [Verrucomicrobiota bacterium]